jgi:hypothetical protein
MWRILSSDVMVQRQCFVFVELGCFMTLIVNGYRHTAIFLVVPRKITSRNEDNQFPGPDLNQ